MTTKDYIRLGMIIVGVVLMIWYVRMFATVDAGSDCVMSSPYTIIENGQVVGREPARPIRCQARSKPAFR